MATEKKPTTKATAKATIKTSAKEVRKNKIVIRLTDREMEALDKYVKKYRAASKASVVRRATLSYIMEQFLSDYPSLFEQNIDTAQQPK